jgi:Domain of unknown function (DUF4062)
LNQLKEDSLTVKRPRPKYQVFISSTYSDLQLEREAVTWEVLTARHIPAGMENFTASNDRGWKVIQRVIDDSDYYVLIFAGKYGSIDAATGKSWTQLEYEYATERGLPVLAFIREKSAITADKMEDDPDVRTKLERFIETIKLKHYVDWWTSQEDLVAKVAAALRNHIVDDEDSDAPRPGWYRGDVVPSASALEEFARLSADNARLQKELEELRRGLATQLILLDEGGAAVHDRVVEHPSLPTDTTKPPSERDAYHRRRNRTHWLSLAVRNTGGAAATDVVIDLTIEGVEAIRLYEEEPPRTGDRLTDPIRPLTRPPTWATDPKEHVYVDGYSVNTGTGYVRQRLKSVAPGFTESIVRVGLQGPVNAAEYLFTVHYRIAHSVGHLTEGKFSIALTFDPNRNMLREMYEEMQARHRRQSLQGPE